MVMIVEGGEEIVNGRCRRYGICVKSLPHLNCFLKRLEWVSPFNLSWAPQWLCKFSKVTVLILSPFLLGTKDGSLLSAKSNSLPFHGHWFLESSPFWQFLCHRSPPPQGLQSQCLMSPTHAELLPSLHLCWFCSAQWNTGTHLPSLLLWPISPMLSLSFSICASLS